MRVEHERVRMLEVHTYGPSTFLYFNSKIDDYAPLRVDHFEAVSSFRDLRVSVQGFIDWYASGDPLGIDVWVPSHSPHELDPTRRSMNMIHLRHDRIAYLREIETEQVAIHEKIWPEYFQEKDIIDFEVGKG